MRRRPQGRLRHRHGQGATLLDACCDRRWPRRSTAKTIDLGELCSTQPDIITNGFVLLEDDKKTQPADNIAPLVRNDFLAKTDKAAFSKLLNDLSAKIDTATLADLYKQVSIDKKDIKDVVVDVAQGEGPRQVSPSHATTTAPAPPGPCPCPAAAVVVTRAASAGVGGHGLGRSGAARCRSMQHDRAADRGHEQRRDVDEQPERQRGLPVDPDRRAIVTTASSNVPT